LKILDHDLLEDRESKEILNRLKPTKRILDVGCGIRPCPVFACEHICLEPYEKYIEILEDWKANSEVKIIHGTIDRIVEIEPSDTTILLLDVIEHLFKEDGIRFLPLIEKFEQAVIFTPLGFKEQTTDAWGLKGDIWQTHRSGWLEDDFKNWETHIWHSKAILAVRYQSSCLTGDGKVN